MLCRAAVRYSFGTHLVWGHTLQTSIAQAAALTIFGNDLLHGYSRADFCLRHRCSHFV